MFNYNNQVTLSQQQQIRDALARNLKIQAGQKQTKEAAAKATRPKLPRFHTQADIDKASVQERMQANSPMLDLGGIKQNANKHQDQSMRPHFDPAPAFPVDGKVTGTNPNMPATPEQSMVDKIMDWKPEGQMSRILQAGSIIGDPLYGTTNKTFGANYDALGPEYHNKDTLNEAKRRAGELKAASEQEKVGRQTSQLEQARQALERKAITPEQFTRMKTQIEGGADLKNVFDAMPDTSGKKGGGDSVAVMVKKQRWQSASEAAKDLKKLEADPNFDPGGYFTPLAQSPRMKTIMNGGKDLLVAMGVTEAGTAMDKINNYQIRSGVWLNQILRDDSGAAVPDTEYARYLSTYIPSIGEGKKAIAEKQKMRDLVTASLGSVIGMTDEQQRNVIDESVWRELQDENPHHSRAELFDMAVRLSILKRAKEGESIANPNENGSNSGSDTSSSNVTIVRYDQHGNKITGE